MIVQSCSTVARLCAKGELSGLGHAAVAAAGLLAGSFGLILAVRFLDSRMDGQGFTVALTALILLRLPDQVSKIADGISVNMAKAFCAVAVLLMATVASVVLAEGFIPLGGGMSMRLNPVGILPAVFTFTLVRIIQAVLGKIFTNADAWIYGTPGLFLYAYLMVSFSFYFLPVLSNSFAVAKKLRMLDVSGLEDGAELQSSFRRSRISVRAIY